MFTYKNQQVHPSYSSKEKFEKHMNLLLIRNESNSEGNKSQGDKSHYVQIKDLNRFMCNKTKHKEKKYFRMSCL